MATSPDNIEHNRADTARTPSPTTRTAQREPQQASAALRQSGHPLPRGDPGRQGAHRQARASLSRQGARDPVQDCDRRAQTSQTAIAEPPDRRPRHAKFLPVRERSAVPPSPPRQHFIDTVFQVGDQTADLLSGPWEAKRSRRFRTVGKVLDLSRTDLESSSSEPGFSIISTRVMENLNATTRGDSHGPW